MASTPLIPDRSTADLADNVWRSPLVPAALAVTAGIVLDRLAPTPLAVSLAAALGCLLAWLAAQRGESRGLSLTYLALAAVACGAAWHHYQHDVFRPDDIGWLAPDMPRPVVLRGFLVDEPVRSPAIVDDPLRSRDRPESATALLRVTALRQGDAWQPVTGRVRVVGTAMPGLHAGDTVELVGRLGPIPPPANPGEFDLAAYWRDRRVRAQLVVRPTEDAMVRLEESWRSSLTGWLAVIRGWGQEQLTAALPPSTGGLAAALLLGEGAPLAASEWDKYLRTGVLHVLAISGQHLVVLAVALGWLLRRVGVRQRPAAGLLAATLLGYALLTGGRPPALRAALLVCVVCAALLLRRRTLAANALALAWLIVALVAPAELFSVGCQLSFLSVLMLAWGIRRWLDRPRDPLEQLIDASRPPWERSLRWVGRQLGNFYLVSILIWLAVTPLAASRYHLVSPVGMLLGPPLLLLTSLALIAGFVLLLAAAIVPLFVPVAAFFVHWPLAACERLVDFGDRLPGGHVYVGDIPTWWLVVFYLGLLAVLTQEAVRQAWRWMAAAGVGWMCVGLLGAAARPQSDELRVTFLAVGHGGCTVLELPDGRTLLYDAGAIAGPEVARRQIAPFLWQRGIRRLDEVFLSHADLDHFNGLPDLLSRFSVGQVTCTPTFGDRTSRAAVFTLEALRRHRIPIRIVKAGDRFAAGAVHVEVLHPPATGPPGNENARSLVLRVRHGRHALLLTGDLEGLGLDRVLRLPPEPIDVLMAPHHGSRLTNPPELARWARPRVVVSCQGPPPGWRERPEPYTAAGARFFGTWPHGAVTVRSHDSGLVVETFVTGERFVVRGGSGLGMSHPLGNNGNELRADARR
jgi:competence protein ComEC